MKALFFFLCLILSHPGLGQDDDEAMLKELEATKTQVIKNAPLNLVEELRNAGHQSLSMEVLMDPKMVPTLRRAIMESRIQSLTLKEAQDLILQKAEGKPLGRFFKSYPKFLSMAAALTIDREALPSLLGILPRRDDLKLFGWCSLGLLILAFILKRAMVSKKAGFFKRFYLTISIQLSVIAVSLGLFYYLFQKELGPALGVIGRYL